MENTKKNSMVDSKQLLSNIQEEMNPSNKLFQLLENTNNNKSQNSVSKSNNSHVNKNNNSGSHKKLIRSPKINSSQKKKRNVSDQGYIHKNVLTEFYSNVKQNESIFLSEQLQKLKAEMEILNSENFSLSKAYQSKEEELQYFLNQIQELGEQKQKAEDKLNQVSENMGQYQKKNTDLLRQTQIYQDDNEKFLKQLKELNLQNEELKQIIQEENKKYFDQIQEQLYLKKQEQCESKQKNQEQTENYKKDVKDYQKQMTKQQNEIQNLQKEISFFHSQKDEQLQLLTDQNNLIQELKKNQNCDQQLINELKFQIQQQNSIENQNNTESLHISESRIRILEIENKELGQKLSFKTLELENEQKKLNSTQSELEVFKNQKQEEEQNIINFYSIKIQSLDNQILTAQQENTNKQLIEQDLLQKIQEKEQIKMNFQQQLSSQQTQLNKLQEELAEMPEIQKKLRNSNQQNQNFQAEIQEKNAIILQIQNKLNSSFEDIKDLKKEAENKFTIYQDLEQSQKQKLAESEKLILGLKSDLGRDQEKLQEKIEENELLKERIIEKEQVFIQICKEQDMVNQEKQKIQEKMYQQQNVKEKLAIEIEKMHGNQKSEKEHFSNELQRFQIKLEAEREQKEFVQLKFQEQDTKFTQLTMELEKQLMYNQQLKLSQQNLKQIQVLLQKADSQINLLENQNDQLQNVLQEKDSLLNERSKQQTEFGAKFLLLAAENERLHNIIKNEIGGVKKYQKKILDLEEEVRRQIAEKNVIESKRQNEQQKVQMVTDYQRIIDELNEEINRLKKYYQCQERKNDRNVSDNKTNYYIQQLESQIHYLNIENQRLNKIILDRCSSEQKITQW